MKSGDTNPPIFNLGPALDFLRQLWQVNHSLEQLSSRMEKRLGITGQQRLMLRCIGQHPGITAGQLALLLHVDPGTVSASLRRLEERNLLQRKRDPKDNRRVSLGLTAQGITLDNPMEGNAEHAVQELLRGTDTAKIQTAIEVLQRLAELLNLESKDLSPFGGDTLPPA